MPETIAAPSTSGAVKEVRIVEGATPPLRSGTGTIRASDISNLPGEPNRPGNGSARSAFTKNLESKAKPAGEPTTVPTEIKEPPKFDDKASGGADDELEGGEPVLDANKQAPKDGKVSDIDPKTGKSKKANPWKLYDTEKQARASAEAEVQRLKSSVVPEQERTAIMERVTKAEARAKELEDHIRFVSYEKSTEFKDQYQAPYEAAWKRATSELSEIAIVDPISQQQRAVTSQDILELVNLPLGKAREVADEVFGKFADDVMAHRKEIRGLFEKQNQALDEAKKNGGQRDQQNREAFQRRTAEVSGFVQKTWKEANDEFLKDPVNGEYFKPKTVKEGQQPTPEESEWNEALERGFKLVDEAWGSNAMAPNLKPEERQAIIKKNAAVRNRAAAFGPLKRLAKRLESKIAKLEKDLEQYSGSTPGAGGSTPQNGVKTVSSAKSAFSERLRKMAH